MGSLRFRCDQCGRSFAFPLDQIPPQGLRGPCGGCGAMLTLFPDGRMLGATPIENPAESAPDPPPPPAPPPAPAPPSMAGSAVSLTFRCPSCGHPHVVDPARLPEGGARGPCARCGARLVLFRDGTVQRDGRIPAPAPPKGTPGEGWLLRLGGEELGPFALPEIRELKAAGRVSAETEVRVPGGPWLRLGTVPVLAALFAAPSPPPNAGEADLGDEDHCYAHPDSEPTRQCSQCLRYLCPDCAKPLPTPPGVRPVFTCASCGGATRAVERRARWRPFYRDLGQVFAAPFVHGAWITYGFLVFLELLKIPSRFAPLVGLAAVFILTCIQCTFYVHVVRGVAGGSYSLPEWPDSTNFLDMVTLFLKVLLVVLVSLLPMVLLFCIGGAGLGVLAGISGPGFGQALLGALGPLVVLVLVLGLLYLIYLPVSIAVVAIFNTVLPALNPILMVRIILRIGPPYFMAVVLWICLGTLNRTALAVLGRLPLLGAALAAPLGVYTTLVSAYILGRVCYENEEKIGWY